VTQDHLWSGYCIFISGCARRTRRSRSHISKQHRGHRRLAAFCHNHDVELVAMEATGGYEQRAFAQLSESDLAVTIVNPRAVRQFAQSMVGWKRPTASMRV